jgi:hypothetical protein
MPRVGFEPKIPVFDRAKTVHALRVDRAAIVIGDRHAIEGNYYHVSLLLATIAITS